MKRNPKRYRAIEARLSREPYIWLATVRGNDRPHLVPMWFVWLEGKVYVATDSHSQKYVNLTVNQGVSISLPDAVAPIILEGEAHACDRVVTDQLGDYFYNKYEWDFRHDRSADYRLVEISVRKILSWGDGYSDSEGIRVI